MVLYVLRGGFILLATSVMMLYLLSSQWGLETTVRDIVIMISCTIGACLLVIALDVLTSGRKVAALTGIFLGLLAGLVTAWAFSFVIDLIYVLFAPGDSEKAYALRNLLQGVKVFVGLITCYFGMSLVVQTKDDFRFVIPYVEFARQYRGARPMLVDTSVLIDGRIEALANANLFQAALLVPRFVVNELQAVADSRDRLKRARGRRGLEVLKKLQGNAKLELSIEDAEAEGVGVDQKLVNLAQANQYRLMTNDFNLAKVAEVRGVEVLSLHELARSMRPVVLPGELLRLTLQREGENAGQGVGYLEDGTMVVVEQGVKHVGEEVQAMVTSTLQTSAGRMFFARLQQDSDAPGHSDADHRGAPVG